MLIHKDIILSFVSTIETLASALVLKLGLICVNLLVQGGVDISHWFKVLHVVFCPISLFLERTLIEIVSLMRLLGAFSQDDDLVLCCCLEHSFPEGVVFTDSDGRLGNDVLFVFYFVLVFVFSQGGHFALTVTFIINLYSLSKSY